MKRLSETEYIHIDKKSKKIKLWHDCEKYKGGKRGIWRTELINENGDDYTCSHCGFTKSVDKDLVLAL